MRKKFPLLDFRGFDDDDDELMIKSLIDSLSNVGFVAIKISHEHASIVKKTQTFAKRTSRNRSSLLLFSKPHFFIKTSQNRNLRFSENDGETSSS